MLFSCKVRSFAKKNEEMPLNAGRRFQQVCNELEVHKKITRQEIAEKMRVRYTTLATYYGMKEFSKTILTKRIPALQEYGVNLAYFEDEEATMWEGEEEQGDDDLLKTLLLRVAENTQETSKAVQNIDLLVQEIKALRQELRQKDSLILQQHNLIADLSRKN